MRVKRGIVSHRKHKKLLESTKGYRMTKRRLVRVAKEAKLHADQYSYAGRRRKKHDVKMVWITRISYAVRPSGLSYSSFMAGMKKAEIKVNRKILAHLIATDNEAFQAILDKVKTVSV